MKLADILDAIYEANQDIYQAWNALPDDVRNHPFMHKPDKPVRFEQFVNTQLPRANWNMRGVVTGARRQWKGRR